METTNEQKTDKINFFGSSNRSNNSYNYSKIADNIEKIANEMQLNFTQSEMKGVKEKKSQFIECSTKGKSNESRIKKAIRARYQKFCILMDEQKNEKLVYAEYLKKDKILQNLLF